MRYLMWMVIVTAALWLTAGTVLTLTGHEQSITVLGEVLVDLAKALTAPLTASSRPH